MKTFFVRIELKKRDIFVSNDTGLLSFKAKHEVGLDSSVVNASSLGNRIPW
jgi:hypothetical protein